MKARNILMVEYATPIRDTVAKKVQFKILGQMMRISQKFIINCMKNLLKNTTLYGNSNA